MTPLPIRLYNFDTDNLAYCTLIN